MPVNLHYCPGAGRARRVAVFQPFATVKYRYLRISI